MTGDACNLKWAEGTTAHELSDGSGTVLFNKNTGALIGLRCSEDDLLSGNVIQESLLNQLQQQGFLETI